MGSVINTATEIVTTATATVTEGLCTLARRDERSSTIEHGDHIAHRPVGQPLEKRINIPALSAIAANKLSSGCSCLNLAPKTVVSTFTPPTQVCRFPVSLQSVGTNT